MLNNEEYLLLLDKSPKLLQISVIHLEGCGKFPMSLQGLKRSIRQGSTMITTTSRSCHRCGRIRSGDTG